jgi:hypothetical protein
LGRDGRGRYNNQPKRGDHNSGGDCGTRRDNHDRGTALEKGSWKKSNNIKGQRNDRDRRDSRDRCKKVDAHHLDPRYTSSNDETKNNDNDTYVKDNEASMSMASSNSDDKNFAVALGTPAKDAKKSERGSTVAKKEVVAACKRKPDAVTVPRKKKGPTKKSSSPTLTTTTTTTIIFSRRAARHWIATPLTFDG